MNKKLKKTLSTILPLLLGVFLVIYSYNQFTTEQIQEIKSYFFKANYWYIFFAAIVAFIGCYSRAYRWKYTLEHLGYNVPFHNQFMAVNISYLVNTVIPRAGEVSRALVLKNYNNVPFDKSFGTIIAERVVDLIFLFIFVLFAIILQFDIAQHFILDKISPQQITLLSLIGIIGISGLFLIFRYSKFKIITTLKEKLSGLKEGFLSIITMKNKWKFLFHTLIIWGSYIGMFYIATFTLEETSNISLGAVITSFVVGSIAIAFTNNGFGAYPYLISEILFFYDIPLTAGIACGWIIWTSQTIMTLLLGWISMMLLPIYNSEKKNAIQDK